MNLQRALQELSISDGMNELAQSTNETNGTFSDVTVFAGSHDGFLSYLGSDVSHCTLKIANPVNVTVGTLVGVRRSDGRVTVARVDPALSTTPPGFVHVTLTSDGSWKDVPLNDLFSLPSAFGQVTSAPVSPTRIVKSCSANLRIQTQILQDSLSLFLFMFIGN